MQDSLVRRARQGVLLASLAGVLGLASCQNVNAFVTGEKFYRAPEGSARVEVELVIEIQDGFYSDLDDEDAKAQLDAEITELVTSLADVGTRFYPIPTQEYGPDDVRPAWVMHVSVDSLELEAEHELIEKEGEESRIESSVTRMDCVARASVEKRRDNAPPLRVGSGEGHGRVHVVEPLEEDPQQSYYRVKRTLDKHEAMKVQHDDVMAAVEETVVEALRQIIKPVDRDFELARQNNL